MRLRTLTCLTTAIALIATTITPAGAGQQTTAIAIRSSLPRIEGETLSGKKIVLPQDAAGRVSLLVFTFSREAGEAAKCWSETFTKIGLPDADAVSFGIMMLEDVPWLLRGLVVSGIKSGVPAATRDRTVKLFADGDAWRARLSVQAVGSPHLVLADRAGRLRWRSADPCNDAGDRQLREQLKILVAEKDPTP